MINPTTTTPAEIGKAMIAHREYFRSAPSAIMGALELAANMVSRLERENPPDWCNSAAVYAVVDCARLVADGLYRRLTDSLGEDDQDLMP